MVPTDEAMITRQMLYSAFPVPATCAVLAIPASIDLRSACRTYAWDVTAGRAANWRLILHVFVLLGRTILGVDSWAARLARIQRKFLEAEKAGFDRGISCSGTTKNEGWGASRAEISSQIGIQTRLRFRRWRNAVCSRSTSHGA